MDSKPPMVIDNNTLAASSQPNIQTRRKKYFVAGANRGQHENATVTSVGVAASAKADNSFDSVATDVDRSSSSHNEVTTTSIESSTTAASTDSTSDSRTQHKLAQMRGDDSGYKSLETQQSLGNKAAVVAIQGLNNNSLEVPPPLSPMAKQFSKLQGESTETPGQLLKETLTCETKEANQPTDITSVTSGSFGRQSVDSPVTWNSSSGYQSLDTPTSFTKTRFLFKIPVFKMESHDAAQQPPEQVQTTGLDLQTQYFLRKAVSQDLGAISPSSVISEKETVVGRGVFTSSLDRFRLQASQYISSAVKQAETIIGHVLEQTKTDQQSTEINEIRLLLFKICSSFFFFK